MFLIGTTLIKCLFNSSIYDDVVFYIYFSSFSLLQNCTCLREALVSGHGCHGVRGSHILGRTIYWLGYVSHSDHRHFHGTSDWSADSDVIPIPYLQTSLFRATNPLAHPNHMLRGCLVDGQRRRHRRRRSHYLFSWSPWQHSQRSQTP